MIADPKEVAPWPWKKGQSGNPKGGRPPGGRSQALGVLEKCLAKAINLQRLEDMFDEEIRQRPKEFWITVVAPLIPKHATLDVGVSNAEEIRGLGVALAAAISGRKIPEEVTEAEVVDSDLPADS